MAAIVEAGFMRMKIKDLLTQDHANVVGQDIQVDGWIKTVRAQKTNTFIEINDGSTFSNLQIVLDPTLDAYENIAVHVTTGASVIITGQVVESPGQNQNIEVHAKTCKI